MLKHMQINDFRVLKNISVTLGKQITVIAGQNGTGKSTILSIIAHSSETKDTNIFGRPYRSQFSEMIKQSLKSDTKNNDCVDFELCAPDNFDVVTEQFHFRRYWVGVGEDGMPIAHKRPILKILPVRAVRGKKDSKIEAPVIYLGLGRLYPVGEAGIKTNTQSYLVLTSEEENAIVSQHLRIMSLQHIYKNNIELEPIELRGVRKKTSGLETSFVDATGNSAGQDNVTQILLALTSFKRLKKSYEEQKKAWNGGFLLIDEFDATLHAKSQILLFEHLLNEAKALNIQVILTSHSMFFLEYLIRNYTKHNPSDEAAANKSVELLYLDNSGGTVVAHRNWDYNNIRNRLMVDSVKQEYDPIPVLTEDAEAQFLFKKLIPNWEKVFRFMPLTSSENQMKALIQDPYITANWLIVHDSDVRYTADELEQSGTFKVFRASTNQPLINPTVNVADNSENIVFLPSEQPLHSAPQAGCRPERLLIQCVRDIADGKTDFFSSYDEFSLQLFWGEDIRMPDDNYEKNKREIDKKWFRDLQAKHPQLLDAVVSFWIQTHEEACKEFRRYVYEKSIKLKKINSTPIPKRYLENLREPMAKPE